ncbi:RBBP9/YdeN family alpha/beta hydrolase [Rhizobium leguminosarum]|uniref:RBBP9/YdeN family alpha/beta hydrolase n=1 Tax=Rhizobium leguminosarum TaxID=384 RepID=UPI001AE5F15E|nr:alpha/beta hydrolase [Rhizobium leguminosarum]MBP2442910.1 putative alpha/beta hydrolase family esterase [Rhizobium leguminosarum]
MKDIIILPGIGGSGEAHWQSRWERSKPEMRRFQPADWDRPDLADWILALDRTVAASATPPLLVAHSLACLLVTHWQQVSLHAVAGAFLVAVPDARSASFPEEAAGFANPPSQTMRFPTLIIASADDPFGTLDYAHARADEWGSGLVEIGPFGHINGQSGLDDWGQGKALLTAFSAGLAKSHRA